MENKESKPERCKCGYTEKGDCMLCEPNDPPVKDPVDNTSIPDFEGRATNYFPYNEAHVKAAVQLQKDAWNDALEYAKAKPVDIVKPDFEKMAQFHAELEYGDPAKVSPRETHWHELFGEAKESYEKGMDKIWTDYVLPLIKERDDMANKFDKENAGWMSAELEITKLQEENTQFVKEIEELKQETSTFLPLINDWMQDMASKEDKETTLERWVIQRYLQNEDTTEGTA